MASTTEPRLAPPGSGLPPIELFCARLFFRLRRWSGSRARDTAKFQLERERIRTLLRSCDAGSGARRVLIRRPPGLEDSSRYWSVWMTLDHLRIVHGEMSRVIVSLTNGQVPEGQASTAAVKPSAEADASVAAAYEASCDALLADAAAEDLNTKGRFRHPWFGPLSAAGWYALAGGHMAIHRVQIARILGAA